MTARHLRSHGSAGSGAGDSAMSKPGCRSGKPAHAPVLPRPLRARRKRGARRRKADCNISKESGPRRPSSAQPHAPWHSAPAGSANRALDAKRQDRRAVPKWQGPRGDVVSPAGPLAFAIRRDPDEQILRRRASTWQAPIDTLLSCFHRSLRLAAAACNGLHQARHQPLLSRRIFTAAFDGNT